jgi:hypothetical protein
MRSLTVKSAGLLKRHTKTRKKEIYILGGAIPLNLRSLESYSKSGGYISMIVIYGSIKSIYQYKKACRRNPNRGRPWERRSVFLG